MSQIVSKYLRRLVCLFQNLLFLSAACGLKVEVNLIVSVLAQETLPGVKVASSPDTPTCIRRGRQLLVSLTGKSTWKDTRCWKRVGHCCVCCCQRWLAVLQKRANLWVSAQTLTWQKCPMDGQNVLFLIKRKPLLQSWAPTPTYDLHICSLRLCMCVF